MECESSDRPGESERPSKEEEDLVTRSTKKVKTKEDEGIPEIVSMVMEIPNKADGSLNEKDGKSGGEHGPEEMEILSEAKQSYQDELLNINHAEEEEIILEAMKDVVGIDWNQNEKDSNDLVEESPFNPCPTINISLEVAEEWCRPWKQALIV